MHMHRRPSASVSDETKHARCSLIAVVLSSRFSGAAALLRAGGLRRAPSFRGGARGPFAVARARAPAPRGHGRRRPCASGEQVEALVDGAVARSATVPEGLHSGRRWRQISTSLSARFFHGDISIGAERAARHCHEHAVAARRQRPRCKRIRQDTTGCRRANL
jgi:hypothetical protein